jgi:hypothetical protein
MSLKLPDALAARLRAAAQADDKSPAELVEALLDRYQKDRSWLETLGYGKERGGQQGLPADASEDAVNDLVNAKIEESRRERGR